MTTDESWENHEHGRLNSKEKQPKIEEEGREEKRQKVVAVQTERTLTLEIATIELVLGIWYKYKLT